MNAFHWHGEPDQTTRRFAQKATFKRTTEGLQTAIEVIVLPEGIVRVVSSEVIPISGTRTIVQNTALLFADIDEMKDAVDLILDRLADEAGGAVAPQEAEEVSRGPVMMDCRRARHCAHSRAAQSRPSRDDRRARATREPRLGDVRSESSRGLPRVPTHGERS
jgi:hypothetical protein